MTLQLDEEIRRQLARFVEGEMTLRAFEEWFVPATWDVEQTDNDEAKRLTHEITHRLNEFSHRDWTKAELVALFRPIVSSQMAPART